MDTTPANELFHNKLVCINYPGYVENVDKMMLTLGGLQNIEQVSTLIVTYLSYTYMYKHC